MQVGSLCPRCFQQAVGPEGVCGLCGAAEEGGREKYPQALPLFGTLHGRYQMGQVLGAGGFGITYLALDLSTRQRYAVKEFFPTELAHREPGSFDIMIPPSRWDEARYGVQRFYDEAQVLASLSGCPSVVHVRDCFQQNQTAYMVMEFIEGPSLKQLCRQGNLPFERGRDLFIDLCLTLDQVHARSLLHRDISPDNILLEKDGSAKLIDFGAARYVVSERSKSLSVVLKPGYAPPEQYSSHGKQGPWTDLYALASTFYFALTGTRVPDAMDRLAGKEAPALSALRPDIPQGFCLLLERCLQPDYRKRFQSCQEVLHAVFSSDWYQTQRRESEPDPLPSPSSLLLPHTASPPKKRSALWAAFRPKRKQLVLEVLSGPLNGETFPLTPPQALIGRSETECQVVLNSAAISRRHCRILMEKGSRLTIEDLSRNGTFWADGRRLEPGQALALPLGKVFYLADRNYTARVVRAKVGPPNQGP